MKNTMGFSEEREELGGIDIKRLIQGLYKVSIGDYSSHFLRAVNDVIATMEQQKSEGMKGDDFFESVCIETFMVRGEYNDREEHIVKNQQDVIDINGCYLLMNEEGDVYVAGAIDIDQQKIADELTEGSFYQQYIELPHKSRIYVDEDESHKDHQLEYRFIPLNWDGNWNPKEAIRTPENIHNNDCLKPRQHGEMVGINHKAKGRLKRYIDTI